MKVIKDKEELKPCKLCGGETLDKGYGVVCLKCGLWLGDGTQLFALGGYRNLWNGVKKERSLDVHIL